MVKRPCLLTNKQLRSDYQCSNISSEDLFVEIFRRMPVKSVCRMRCVSKSWNNLISSSFFIAHYHQNFSSIPVTQKSFLLFTRRASTSYLYAFYHPDQGVPFDRHTTFESLPFEPLPFRTRHRYNHLTFLDAIHGVVCLTSPSKNPTTSRTILWNPTIRKYIVIPSSPFKFKRITSYAPSLGFGFNSLADDFNLIRLWMPFHPEPGDKGHALLVYEVFSAREGIWRKAVGSKIRPGKVISDTSFFMNTRIHWIVSTYKARIRYRSRFWVLTFDCERKEFTTMKLPRKFNQMEEVYNKRPVFFKCRGMLSVLALISGAINIWVMEEYGNASTWKNLPYIECRDEFDGLVLEESMLLMDAKRQVVSYAEKHDRHDGKVYYEIDGRTSEHILI